MFIGMICGVSLSGYTGDLLGRKKSMFIYSIVLLVGALGSVMMPEVWSLTLMFAVVGVGLGALIPLCVT